MTSRSEPPFKELRPAGKRWPPPVESFLGKLETWLAESRFAVAATLIPEEPEVSGQKAVLRLVPESSGMASLEVSVFADLEPEPEFHFSLCGTLPADALPSTLKRYAKGPRDILWAGENDRLNEEVVLEMCQGVAEGRIAQRLLIGGKWIVGNRAELSYGYIGRYSYYSGLSALGGSLLLPFVGLARTIEVRYRPWGRN